ncbi:MAG: UXX-star selenoprotein family 1 [Anaerolineae bacterium]
MSETIIFTKPGCPYCAAAKDHFQRQGIQYTEYNVMADSNVLHRMLELNGGRRQVPTIVQDNQVMVGFHGS